MATEKNRCSLSHGHLDERYNPVKPDDFRHHTGYSRTRITMEIIMTTLSTPLLVTFLVYIFGMVLIGLMAYRATHNFGDYILGGRRMGSVVTALSAGASDMSGWLLMGLPGAVFLSGISESWIAIGLTIGAYLNWTWVAGRLRVHTEINHNALTLPDYFSHRFEDKSKLLRVISALVILVFFTIYCASGIVAGARLFESTFGMSYDTALWAGAAATIAYTFIGGYLAVSWTDTVQASLMIFALILTPVIVILSVGGVAPSLAVIAAKNPANLDMFKGLDTIAILSLLGWGLGYFGQPHILARFMAADSHHTIRNARRISMTWMVLCLAGAVTVGFFGIAYFTGNPSQAGNVSQNGERVFIELARLLFNPWIAGVLLSAILAAVMSTLSCQLLVCSSAITEDLYKPFLRKNASQRELVWVGRAMVLLVSVIAIALAVNPENRVLGLVSYAWAGFGAAFGPVILISLLWPRMTRNGALVGMLVGAATVIIWKQYGWLKLYEIIPGFLLASLSIVVVSLLGRAPSAVVTARFQQAEHVFKSRPAE
ncbi:Proline/sodium symporter PutP (TC 2.A.21.2.1) @ Propionate/sodium symporter [Dickeya aquatica]|uniref:Sodium/proline symporter n=2 Tax=Pectobacteriaceae TaxID=1903410 RepID=A0A375AG22_9GAMM|nr:Proline/sodium symporter PutP (TC 2.A.21.2.1) @ Propionate/sodium symporter [Dickeya aquatica]